MSPDFQLTSPNGSKASRVRRGGWSWGPVEGARLRTLSLGGGIQSTTAALMAAHGEITPMPDQALYAPVGDSEATRAHIRWLASGNVLPFPVIELPEPPVTLRQSIEHRAKATGERYVSIPFHLDGAKRGMDRRQCTREYKVDRLNAAQRQQLGYQPRQRIPAGSVEVWIGYSTDEVVRAGAAFETWAVNRFPLLEQRMSIGDCVAWLEKHGYPVPPRSKCTFCPYREDAEWRWLKDNDPAAWADAVEIDRMIRDTPGMRAKSYLHRSRQPLDQVDLSSDADRGQGMLMLCAGDCGV